jgi:drug/metabolite transporter (DMT)-like permease
MAGGGAERSVPRTIPAVEFARVEEASIPARSVLIVHLSLLLVALVWGSNFVAIKYLLESLSPGHLVTLRLLMASLVFVPIVLVLARGVPAIRRADWPRVVTLALVGITINTTAIAFGTQLIPAAVASLIVVGNPVFTALLAWLIAGEQLTTRKMAGVAIAFAGFLVVLLYGGPEARFSVQNALGVIITMGGPVAWAFYTVLSKPMQGRYDPVQFVGVVTIVGTVPFLPFVAFNPGMLRAVVEFGGYDWLAMAVTAVLALIVAYILWFRGLSVLEPTQLAVYVYLVPVFGAVLARVLLGERITVFLLLGGLTILAGVIITNTTRRGPVDADPAHPRSDASTPRAALDTTAPAAAEE